MTGETGVVEIAVEFDECSEDKTESSEQPLMDDGWMMGG
jgi:hypothetical protein